jgi:hypothetical protein
MRAIIIPANVGEPIREAYNLRATVALMKPEMGYMSGDYIAGDAVLIGANPMGEDVDLPADITVESLFGAAV